MHNCLAIKLNNNPIRKENKCIVYVNRHDLILIEEERLILTMGRMAEKMAN
jgi:hypothetical protein